MIALLPWRWQAHILAWFGHSAAHIAKRVDRPMNDVERALGWCA